MADVPVDRPDPTRRVVEGEYEPRSALIEWWRARRRRRDCFHHEPHSGVSFIRSQLFDLGMSKMWWCTKCGRHWTT